MQVNEVLWEHHYPTYGPMFSSTNVTSMDKKCILE